MPANAPPRAPGELAEIEAIIRRHIQCQWSGEPFSGLTFVLLGIPEAAAEIAALRASEDGGEAKGWQPIETAPDEGEFLAGVHVRRHDPFTHEIVDKWEEIHVIAIDDETGEIADGYEHGWRLSDYEFWKPLDPLPEPPALSSPTKIEGADE